MVALVIIYNHKFDRNIPILEEIYAGRFTHIFHLVPFYTGVKENVIAVYENSYYFQGYIAQASAILNLKGSFEHYVFIADDLLLNPAINEDNYKNHFNLDNASSFLPDYIELSKRNDSWSRLSDAINYKGTISGLEIQNELPSYDEVLKKFTQKNLDEPFVKSHFVYKLPIRKNYRKTIIGYLKYFYDKRKIKKLLEIKEVKLNYPLVGSYSDIFIITNHEFNQFSHLCGIFSANKLFVELAIPTAMVITCEKIITEKNISKKGLTFWIPEELEKFQEKYESSLNQLLNNFPENTLYVHPVKLSKWERN